MEKENKGGIRRLFNVFDLALIALAVLLLAALFINGRRAKPQETGPAAGTVRYVLEISGLDESMAGCVQEGDEVVDRIRRYDVGTVESVEVTPALRQVTDQENGRIVQAQVPGQVTLLLTVTSPAAVSDRSILLDGGYEIKVGATVSLKTPQLSAVGVVLQIERGE